MRLLLLMLVLMLICILRSAANKTSGKEKPDEPFDKVKLRKPKVSIWDGIIETNTKMNGSLYDDDGTFSRDEEPYSLVELDIRKYRGEERQSAPKKKLDAPFYWHKHLWRRVIPYEVHSSLSSITNMIETELRKIEQKTCIRFRKRVSSDIRWIRYSNGRDCSSGVGRSVSSKGARGISLAPLCRDPGTIAHETLHNLGLWHEQSRSDRDSYVKLFKNNIQKSALDQFRKQKYSLLLTPYDLKSVMHYNNDAFVISHDYGDSMQYKFDPNFPLGGHVPTPSDFADINLMYQCDIKSGWSRWSGYSPCIKNYWKQCLKANVRFCTSINWDECPNHTRHGTQEHVIECDMRECDYPKINGVWGNWGAFSRCSSACGWGYHTRYRKCDNPTPRNGGKACPGSNKQDQLCRRRRCNRANGADIDFESGKKGFIFDGFRIASGKANHKNSGPSRDHTSSLGYSGGGYALASKVNGEFIKKIAKLKSPWIKTLLNKEKCVVFHYFLNGETLHEQALFMYVEFPDKRIKNLPFLKGGHQGNYWRRAAVRIPPMNFPFRFVFESRFHPYLFADVAIDDVMLDHEPCMKGLDGCYDSNSNCLKWAKENRCKKPKEMRYMLTVCCASCSDPNKAFPPSKCKKDNYESCEAWADKGYCKKNPGYMLKQCCVACKNVGKKKKCEDKHQSCKKWAETEECKKNPDYMLINCCKSCKGVEEPKKICSNKADRKYCGASGRSGDCKTEKFKKWMAENCCQTCYLLENPRRCSGETNPAFKSKCTEWAKRGDCKKNPWMMDNCCPDCKIYG